MRKEQGAFMKRAFITGTAGFIGFHLAQRMLDQGWQVHGLDGAPEWPAIRAMLPDVAGRRVADLGCGFGWASRWFREQGAASVTGYDLSQNMIARARANTSGPSIDYRISDLEVLDLPEAAFDLVYSALTFHYVADFDRLVRPEDMVGQKR